jgi:predicted GNAT family acetyltransferase
MEAILLRDVSEFEAMTGDFLRKEPFTSNVIGVQVAGVVSGVRPQAPEDIWAIVRDRSEVLGVAMLNPPFHLFVSRMPDAAARCLAGKLLEKNIGLPGVNGEVNAVEAFSDVWTGSRQITHSTLVSMRMYRLEELHEPLGVSGATRTADESDSALIAGWLEDFEAEALPPEMVRNVASMAEERIARGEFVIWVDDTAPVALAGFRPPAVGVSRIGPVYTPMPNRRRGYGAAVTARASLAAREHGASHVVLYADRSNPTSNGVYQSIGFVADHDFEERIFRFEIT